MCMPVCVCARARACVSVAERLYVTAAESNHTQNQGGRTRKREMEERKT